jgi:hypothetical protein
MEKTQLANPCADGASAFQADPDPLRELHALIEFLALERVSMIRFGVAAPTSRPERASILVQRLRPSVQSSDDGPRQMYERAVQMAAAHRRAIDDALARIGRSLGEER